MVNMELLEEFVGLKRQIEILRKRMDKIKGEVISQINQQGGKMIVGDALLGTGVRVTYEFSESVSKLADALRTIKEQERRKGSARVKKQVDFVTVRLETVRRTRKKSGAQGAAKYIHDVRKQHSRAYEAWSQDEKDCLKEEFENGLGVDDLAVMFQRQPGGIKSQLVKMGLL